MAAILSESHQEIVDVDPEVFWENGLECSFGGVRGLGGRQAEAIRNPVDMGVDTDRRDPETQAEDKIGGLAADPGEFEQRRLVVGYDAAVIRSQDRRYPAQLTGLGVVETGRVDGLRDLFLGKIGELGWSIGEPEETPAGLVSDLVLGSERDDARNQEVKRRSPGCLDLGQGGDATGGPEGVEPGFEVPDRVKRPGRTDGAGSLSRHPSMMGGGIGRVKLQILSNAMQSH